MGRGRAGIEQAKEAEVAMPSLFRRLFPKAQDATCSHCGLALRERRRKPCPRCGDTRRTLVRGFVAANIVTRDEMG